MKTKADIEAVVEVQRSEKLKRRATTKGRTVAESAMIRAFNAQFAEYSSELKKTRAFQEKDSETGIRLRDKYLPVSGFDVAINIYVEGLIERKMTSFALREADTLQLVLKEMESFEVTVSSKDGDCRVGEKRKGFGSVLAHGGETLPKMKRRLTQRRRCN
ncbi:hypothetical protein CARUB_v10012393mg [Capsella rubella]|uniref:Uncharacterized protein n=1 Tax=Capsella rubella TaxID=81985 RepID=R0IH39_9BRAS|nr:hypothetical protein CARUB_v10012393mg [Capsella rubella]